MLWILFKYFQYTDSVPPKPDGPLSAVVSASGVKAANDEAKFVSNLMESILQ